MGGRRLVVQEIKRRLSAGALRPGARLPSERELAHSIGVSRSSVQSGFKELEAMGLVLRQPNRRPMILPVAVKKPDPGSKVADQIAVWILPDTQDLGGAMMLQGIRSGFGSGDYRLLIGCPPSYEKGALEEAEVDFFRSLVDNPKIAGAIVWDTCNPRSRHAYQALIEAGIPLVFIDREPSAPLAVDVVSTNNRKAASSAVRHLVELGHQRIAMVLGPDRASSVLDRIDGYRTALREAGASSGDDMIFDMRLGAGGSHLSAAEETLVRMLRTPNPPTAAFAMNDRIALLLIEAAKSLRIRVPERLSVVGFDWLLRWLPSGGELTTVSQPFDEIGRAAAQRLLERVAMKAGQTTRQILLDAPLVIKQSTAAPCSKHSSTLQVIGDSHALTQTSVHAH